MDIINTIVIPICRDDRVLRALTTLKENTPKNYKTIVIDQTAHEPYSEFFGWLYDAADIVIKPHLNYGFAQAANMGIRVAPTPYVTVMNDDVEFIPGHDWWGGVMETFDRFPKAAAVNPQSPKEPGWGWGEPGYRYLVPKEWERAKGIDGRELAVLGREDRVLRDEFRTTRLKLHDNGVTGAAANEILDPIRQEMIEVRQILEPRVYDAVMSDPEYVQMLADDRNWAVVDGFPCWLAVFKRDRLEEMGLFDERFFPGGGEDYDLMHRGYRAGYRMLASSRSWVWHWWGQSKDRADGRAGALPDAHEPWNKLSTKGFGDEGLYEPDCDVWANQGYRTDDEIHRACL